jgi:hypothetical protein
LLPAAAAVVAARARTATFTALLPLGVADGVKWKLPPLSPRLANKAARRGSATAGVNPPTAKVGVDGFFLALG